MYPGLKVLSAAEWESAINKLSEFLVSGVEIFPELRTPPYDYEKLPNPRDPDSFIFRIFNKESGNYFGFCPYEHTAVRVVQLLNEGEAMDALHLLAEVSEM